VSHKANPRDRPVNYIVFGLETKVTSGGRMKYLTKLLICGLFLVALSGAAKAQTINAVTCNASDVQAAINSAPEGGTVTIPAGTCTWTSGVTISGKGIAVQGAGTSRVIAVSSTPLTLGTGSQTLSVVGADPGTTLAISAGTTLELEETGTETNYMIGTVSAYNPATGSLTLDITSDGGSCGSNSLSNCSRWLVATVPAAVTTIVNDDPGTSGGLFNITEDTSVNTSVSDLQVLSGTQGDGGTSMDNVFILNYASGGQAILLHDFRISENVNNTEPPSGNGSMIMSYTDRGVIWNATFDAAPYALSNLEAVYLKDQGNVTNAWTQPDNMGSLDTTGQYKMYIEDSDFHAMLMGPSIDDNGRMVIRYSMFDNAGVGTHGADTSNYGQRYFEFYNNVGVFEGYSNGKTFNLNQWIYMRGGTAIIYNNNLPAINSQDYPNKPDINMTVMNLQRSGGPNPCWGAGLASPSGQNYHAPRQVGYGYVTGTGTASYTGASPNPIYTVNGSDDSFTYVGDSDPVYIWGNSRSPLNIGISDYGAGECTNPDTSANYLELNRDYFNGTTARPGWSPYTYPHPLRGGSSSGTPPAPTGLTGAVTAP